ncbi:hypothetical protein O9992_04800 [Vibrio lentus]|nr:hypothetical protein [Vibrio lentus]
MDDETVTYCCCTLYCFTCSNLYADETTPLEFNGYMRGGVGLK